MEKIKEILNNTCHFEELMVRIQKKDILDITTNYLKELNLNDKLTDREFLGMWIIYKYPKDTMGRNPNQQLFNEIEKVFTEKGDIIYTVKLFRDWLRKDKDLLINDLFYTYHNLGVDILNAPEESMEYIQKARKQILKSAQNIAGQDLVEEILNYKPVVVDVQKLNQIAKKAFWDNIKEQYTNKKYDWIYFILEHILNLLKIINPNSQDFYSEIIDVSFIKQQVDHDAFEDSQMLGLALSILNCVEKLHAPVYDIETKKIKEDIGEKGLDLPMFLKDIVLRLEIIVKMILKFKKQS